MKNIAYWTTFVVVTLSLAMFIFSCGTLYRICPTNPKNANNVVTDTASIRVAEVTSNKKSKVLRVLAPDNSFVVRGQILYILDGSDIWKEIEKTEVLLRREMKNADAYSRLKYTSQSAAMHYSSSYRRVEELNAKRNQLYAELSKTRVRAPHSGTLGLSQVKSGDEVYPGRLLNKIEKYEYMNRTLQTAIASDDKQCESNIQQHS